MATSTTQLLTYDDLVAALNDDRHLSFGYAERRYLPQRRREQLDRAVLRRANTLGWNYEALFAWVNGKNARWACDLATDRDHTPTGIVERYMVDGWDK